MLGRTIATIGVATVALLTLGACGTIAKTDIEKAVKGQLPAAIKADSVDCAGPLRMKVGTKLKCTAVAADDSRLPLTLTVDRVSGGKAHYQIKSGTPLVGESAVEKTIADLLEKSVGQRPDKVDCPSDMKETVGTKMRCVLTAGTDKLGLTATITSATGSNFHLDVQVDDHPQ